ALDIHERAQAQFSLAYKANFLERPIVNEYTEFLWALISQLCPNLQRSERSFSIRPTHDIDMMSYHESLNILRTIGGLTLKQKRPYEALKTGCNWLGSYLSPYEKDS